MSTVVFVSWWGGGNMTPVLSLGAEMRRRGHDVTVIGPAQFADRLALDGIGHVPSAHFSPTADEVREHVRRLRPDLLVIDGMMGDVVAVAPTFADDGAGRTAALVHTMWQPVADKQWDNVIVFHGLERINEIRRTHGLAEVEHGTDLLRDVDHVLASMPEPLDRPLESHWPHAQYLGPLLEDPGPDAAWMPPPGYGPLVVVGLGTTPMDEDGAIRRVLQAVGGISGARFLVTIGDHIDPAGFEEPANVLITRYVRHAAVLPHASLVVSHAGLGTTIAAAAHGLPMVCMPLGRDQPGNAERVKELGIGAAIDPETPPEGVRVAIERLLEADEVRRAAIALAGTIVERHPAPHDAFEALL